MVCRQSNKARRDVEAHLFLPMQVARMTRKKVRAGGTLLFMGGTGGRATAPGMALIGALTAAMPALVRNLALEIAPVRVNLIAACQSRTRPTSHSKDRDL
jgi:enoyl-[acyl-carrier-protein] reductase (NADH)